MPTTQELIAERKAALEKQRLNALRHDIRNAMYYLNTRFNAYVNEEKTPSGLLDPQTWRVEFPEPDKARVVKIFMGKEMEVTELELRLTWERTGKDRVYLYWIGDILLRREFWGVENELKYFVDIAQGRP